MLFANSLIPNVQKRGVYPDFIELMLGHKLPGVRRSLYEARY